MLLAVVNDYFWVAIILVLVLITKNALLKCILVLGLVN